MLTVIVIIGILSVMLMPVVSKIQQRVEKANCTMNMRNLYVGANLYLQNYQQWPQINPNLITSNKREYATQWISALQPFGIDRKTWLCPTTQRLLGGPDYTKPELTRVDYLAMPFDNKAYTPHRWPKQPWFIEAGALHGKGNLIIYTDGSVAEAYDVIRSILR